MDLAGIDCSALLQGPFSWEHQNTQPNQLVGKILEYKKIFSEADCENEHHKRFWEKCQNPFLYVMGRLFDDKKDSSKEVAALFIDDAEHPDEPPMVGFSIEGSKVDKKGIIVTKSIARKVTVTNAPANKQCVAELIPGPEVKQKSEDSIFKSEFTHTIDLVKTELKKDGNMPAPAASPKPDLGWTANPTPFGNPMSNLMSGLGMGKKEMKKSQVPGSKYPPKSDVKPGTPPQEKVGGIPKFGPIAKPTPKPLEKARVDEGKTPERKAWDRSARNDRTGTTTTTWIKRPSAVGELLGAKPKKETQTNTRSHAAAGNIDMRIGTAATPGHAPRTSSTHGGGTVTSSRKVIGTPAKSMQKAMTAGSGMAGPGTLSGGAALSKESLDKKMKKAELLKRAKEAYQTWEKREAFENFMAKSMPELTKHEIIAIGQTIALSKSLKAEAKLAKMLTSKEAIDENEIGTKFDKNMAGDNISSYVSPATGNLGASEDFKKAEKKAPGEYGNVEPHTSHKGMMGLGFDFHMKQSGIHKEHAEKAHTSGNKDLGQKHREMAEMHRMYTHALPHEKDEPGRDYSSAEKSAKKLRIALTKSESE